MFPRNAGFYPRVFTASRPRSTSSPLPPWEPQTPHMCSVTSYKVTALRTQHSRQYTELCSLAMQCPGHLTGSATTANCTYNRAVASVFFSAVVPLQLWTIICAAPPPFGRRRVPGVVNGIFLLASGRGWGLASSGPLPQGDWVIRQGAPAPETTAKYTFLTRTCKTSLWTKYQNTDMSDRHSTYSWHRKWLAGAER
jgi:hypothetical protein